MSWQTYSQTEAEIVSISEYPVGENSGYYHWSQGNSNASLYPFTVYLDEDTPVREGEYVNITYNPFGSSASGVYLQNMFILREGGGSFVYVRDANGKLEKRAVSTRALALGFVYADQRRTHRRGIHCLPVRQQYPSRSKDRDIRRRVVL